MKKNILVEKRFTASGLRCHVIFSDMGHRCGYVTIPELHPLYGVGYDDPKVYGIEVHGGLTYAGASRTKKGWVFGFDCAHCDDKHDLEGVKKHWPDAYVLTSPYYKNEQGTIKTLAFVEKELRNLAKQIA